jgi:exopolyphosphatase/guanosine-5'-triphosphate,3'-diphosphate pyrophosphatase
LRSLILSYSHVDELDIEGLKPERKSVFPSGVAILLATFDALGIERMEYSDGALREGVLYDVLGRLSHEDVRERTVLALMERFHVAKEHAAVCEQTAVTLFDQFKDAWSLKAQDRELLSWAACLHEVGRVIAHNQFHKHGAYLIAQSDLAGFTKGEQEELSILVRLHRRKMSLLVLDDLEPARAKELKRLIILLRLAITLCAPRFMTQPPKVTIRWVNEVIELSFQDDWPSEYSLGLDMLKEEMKIWAKIGIEGRVVLDS